jgi:hypothetical protein
MELEIFAYNIEYNGLSRGIDGGVIAATISTNETSAHRISIRSDFRLVHMALAKPLVRFVGRAWEHADSRFLAASSVAPDGCVRGEVGIGVASLLNRVLYELCNGKCMRNRDNHRVPPQ